MIIKLTTADFSGNYITKLDKWNIVTTLGTGASYSGPVLVDKGSSLSATVTIGDGYSLSGMGYTIKMGEATLTDAATMVGNVITITIPEVTDTIYISVPTVNNSTGEEDEGEDEGDASIITFENEDFEVGAYDATGGKVDIASRYRTIETKIFDNDVTFNASTLSDASAPCSLRFLEYNGSSPTLSAWITDSYTVAANTEFHLILAKAGQSGDVVRSTVYITVPENATRMYVNTLQTEKENSFVKLDGQIISTDEFVNGLYYYGTVGNAKQTVTSSSKMAGLQNYIAVAGGQVLEVEIFTSATIGYIFTDNNDIVVEIDQPTKFAGKTYEPLEFFTYEVK